MRPCRVRRLGTVGYAAAQELQRRLVRERQEDLIDDLLLLVEHPPVVTLGKADSLQFLRVPPETLEERGVELHASDRGGEITFHGPGQMVAYPILKLDEDRRDLHRYLRDLEEVGIALLADYGLKGCRVPGRTGVWVDGEKVAAIGVRASRWVTSHGIAVNVGEDLSGFELIVPCGLADAGVGSLARLLGRTPPMEEVQERFCSPFGRIMKRRMIESDTPCPKSS